MDLAAVQATVETWLNLTAVDPSQDPPQPLPVYFARQPHRFQLAPQVLVYPGPILKVGHDFPQYVYDETTEENIEQMYGVRKMIVRLSFRTFDQSWGNSARQFAEDWRIRTESTRSVAAMSNGGLAIWGTGELVETDYEWSGRMVSQVDVDATLGLWGFERNASTDEGYIETIVVEGERVVIDEYGQGVTENDATIITEENAIDFTVTTD